MTEEALLIRLANDLAELERVAGLVERFGAEHGLPEHAVFEINLALDEVLTNVISYGHDDGGRHEIEVRLAAGRGEVAIEVTDDGRPFDPLSAPEPATDVPLAERPVGGLGIHMVRKLMDRIEYRRDGARNVLTMRKRTAEAK
jgi:anti-sigma regulatory factor (Ser/Thr protein kinase)